MKLKFAHDDFCIPPETLAAWALEEDCNNAPEYFPENIVPYHLRRTGFFISRNL